MIIAEGEIETVEVRFALPDVGTDQESDPFIRIEPLDPLHHDGILVNLIEIFSVEESLVIPMTNVNPDEQVAAFARPLDQCLNIMLEDFERLKVGADSVRVTCKIGAITKLPALHEKDARTPRRFQKFRPVEANLFVFPIYRHGPQRPCLDAAPDQYARQIIV